MNEKKLNYLERQIIAGEAPPGEKEKYVMQLQRNIRIHRIILIITIFLLAGWTISTFLEGFEWRQLIPVVIFINVIVISYFSKRANKKRLEFFSTPVKNS